MSENATNNDLTQARDNMVNAPEQFKRNEEKRDAIKSQSFVGNTLVLAWGQGGGNVGSLTHDKKLLTVAVNTSVQDLKEINAFRKIHIEGKDGSGNNRDRAYYMFEESYGDILEPVYELVEEYDINQIAVVGTSNGGTASGTTAPSIAVLKNKYPKKIVYGIGIVGSIKESHNKLENGKNFITELENLNVPYLLFENDCIKSTDLSEVYSGINKAIADTIEVLDGYMYDAAKNGNLDTMDKASLFKPGRMSVTVIDEIKTSVSSDITVDEYMIDRIENNLQSGIGNFCNTYGVFLSTPNLGKFDTHFTKIQDKYGEADRTFTHFQDSNGLAPEAVIIQSGLDAPIERFELIESRLNERQEVRRRSLPKSTVDTSFLKENHLDEKDGPVEEPSSDPLALFKR